MHKDTYSYEAPPKTDRSDGDLDLGHNELEQIAIRLSAPRIVRQPREEGCRSELLHFVLVSDLQVSIDL